MKRGIFVVLGMVLFLNIIQMDICMANAYDACNTGLWGAQQAGSTIRDNAKVGDVIYAQKNNADTIGHVGIVVDTPSGLRIVESMPAGGVQTNDFDKWCCWWNWIALLRVTDDPNIAQQAANNAKTRSGMYTAFFLSCNDWCDDSKWYCSELVYKAYRSAGLVFQTFGVGISPRGIYNRAENKHIGQWRFSKNRWASDNVYDTLTDDSSVYGGVSTVVGMAAGGQSCCSCPNSIGNCN